MPSGLYVTAMKEICDNTLDIDTDALKVMLVTSSYTYDADHDFVSDVVANEISVTGYTGGFGGAGRKSAGTIAVVANKTNNRADIGLAADITWTALGAGATIGGAILIKEITNDAASRVICFWDLTDTATNGGDVTLDFTVAASGGNIQISV